MEFEIGNLYKLKKGEREMFIPGSFNQKSEFVYDDELDKKKPFVIEYDSEELFIYLGPRADPTGEEQFLMFIGPDGKVVESWHSEASLVRTLEETDS